MSLDDFIVGPGDTNDNPSVPTGSGCTSGWATAEKTSAATGPGDEAGQTVFDELMSTGAVITGRRTGDYVGYWGGDDHDGVPIFVPTHQASGTRSPAASAP